MRLFFAVLPDAATCEALAARVRALPLGPAARPVPRNNYHVTLAFVGDVASGEVADLRRIGAAQRAPIWTLALDAYDYWPKPEVVVAAARSVPEALEALWRTLHAELAEHQWALHPKRLRPHVTLARKVAQAPVLPSMSALAWLARDFCLMQSDTGGAESVYTVVDRWPLLDGGAED